MYDATTQQEWAKDILRGYLIFVIAHHHCTIRHGDTRKFRANREKYGRFCDILCQDFFGDVALHLGELSQCYCPSQMSKLHFCSLEGSTSFFQWKVMLYSFPT